MTAPRLPGRTGNPERDRRARAIALGDAAAWTPPEVRDAATVILLRDSPDGPQVHLQRRAAALSFASGMHVFPGGRVDAADYEPAVPWRASPGSSLPQPALRRTTAEALIVAGIRETYEEIGVLLAVDPSGRAPATDDATWLRDRLALVRGELGFAEFLTARGLLIDPASVAMWSHWVSPATESRRYDTRFFVAEVPAGQADSELVMDHHDDTVLVAESEGQQWLRPADALAEAAAGSLPLLRPTAQTLATLVGFDSVADVRHAAVHREVRPRMGHPVAIDGDRVVWAEVDAYTGETIGAFDIAVPPSEVDGMTERGEPDGMTERGEPDGMTEVSDP
ncbi:MAG: NUDIX hydrolase [Actinomycetota bacterium]|nr:MAG: NUDIX hydrolase [Actinomycetota bacterium]